jgi:hypothetical protein
MPEFDLDRAYREASAAYTPADYEKFLAAAQVSDPKHRELGEIFLRLAGCIYLGALQHQALTPTRTELVSHIQKAQAASRDLARHLRGAFADYEFGRSVLKQCLDHEDEARNPRHIKSGAYDILAAALPFDDHVRGFQIDGLLEALDFVAARLGEIEVDKTQKPVKGRTKALKYWLQAMGLFWVIAKDEEPAPGKYDSEVSDYSSPDVAALTLAAETLDPEINSRLVVAALLDAKQDFSASLDGPGLLLGEAALAAWRVEGHFGALTPLLEHIGLPGDMLDQVAEPGGRAEPTPDAPRAMIADVFYEETVESAISEIRLFPGLVDENNE